MLNKNRNQGQTLPLIVVSTIVLAAFGVAVFFLLQIFGGNGEHRNATDSGILNLNKEAIALGAPFNTRSEFQSMFRATSGASTIDLATYNRMVSAATLIAMNASSDGLESGQKNAANVIAELQRSEQSVGGQLKKLLEDPDAKNGWAGASFAKTAHANSERMSGQDAQAQWDKSQYKVAYLETSTDDTAASNVPVDKMVDNMPLAYDEQGLSGKKMDVPAKLVSTEGGNKYLHGYAPINIPNIAYPIYAVPTQPQRQPHLLSLNTFAQHQEQPGLGTGVFLPPNGFKGGAKTSNAIAKTELSSTAAGIVGMPGDVQAGQARLPQGFIVIDNSMTANSNTNVPNGDNWEACEAGTGTLVYRPNHLFSTDSTVNGQPYNALSSWLQTPRDSNFDANSGPPIQDDEGNALLYDSSGSPITSKAEAAKQIPFDNNPNNVVLATDQDSDPNGNNPDPDCVILATPTLPDNLSPFNRAYHPNANASNGSSNGLNLTATEQAKMYALHLYGPQYRAGTRGVYDRNFGLTGMRVYPKGGLPHIAGPFTYAPEGANLPMGNPTRVSYGDPKVMGKVTTDGTIQELFQQTTGNPEAQPYIRIDNDANHTRVIKQAESTTPYQEVQQFIMQRMKEIKPNASNSDFDKVFQQKLPLGTRYYVYLKNPSDANSEFVISVQAPSWATSILPDGKRHAFSVTYPISGGTRDTGYMVDSPNDFGIHDHLFMTNTVNAQATDAVSYQSSSGANGLLGYVKFIEFVKASGSLTIPNL